MSLAIQPFRSSRIPLQTQPRFGCEECGGKNKDKEGTGTATMQQNHGGDSWLWHHTKECGPYVGGGAVILALLSYRFRDTLKTLGSQLREKLRRPSQPVKP